MDLINRKIVLFLDHVNFDSKEMLDCREKYWKRIQARYARFDVKERINNIVTIIDTQQQELRMCYN
jgi:hypothetical protein